MPAARQIIGTIRIESLPETIGGAMRCDDSSLALLFASLAHCDVLAAADCDEPRRLIARGRLCRPAATIAGDGSARANLAALQQELEDEFAELSDDL